ncbi:MAG TPA: Imm63 family immunity protein [Longimicrobium sp.]|nr:Imm63 family immunity protein [Longimicrobium sp.]
MSFSSLSDIESRVNQLAGRIAVPANLLPTFGHSEDFARPHVEVDSRGYHYVVVERGQELRRVTTGSMDELLSLIFADVTFSMACDFELKHRVDGQDSRRLLFATQVDLLSRLSPDWGRLEAARHQAILGNHPFRDYVEPRKTTP